jgi:hypothetical protein
MRTDIRRCPCPGAFVKYTVALQTGDKSLSFYEREFLEGSPPVVLARLLRA